MKRAADERLKDGDEDEKENRFPLPEASLYTKVQDAAHLTNAVSAMLIQCQHKEPDVFVSCFSASLALYFHKA